MVGAGGNRRIATALLGGLAAAVMAVLIMTSAVAADMDAPAYRAPQSGIVGWGGWIFYPSVILGAVYDDNIYRSETNRIHSWGTRVIPSFTGELNEGIYRTSVYGTADARFYSDNTGANAVDAKAGIKHVYEAQRDLIFRFSGDYLRQADPFNAGVVAPNGGSDREQQQRQQFHRNRFGREGLRSCFRRVGRDRQSNQLRRFIATRA
jgi:hypothetical protein